MSDRPTPCDPAADLLLAPARRVEAFLESFVRAAAMPRNLTDAVLYSLLAPGKRLRPALVLHAYAALGSEPSNACTAAAGAVELVHCFSLVHDDLPALDNDDLRRGRPTLHIHAGEALAILAGDAMLALAFRLLASRAGDAGAELTSILAGATARMVCGQVHDTRPDFDPSLPPAARLETIHRDKTGALITAACRIGVVLRYSEPDPPPLPKPDALDAITRYADAVGLMFQAVDDLIDAEQETHHAGKRTGKDAHAGKLTYPAVFGLEGARSEIRRLHALADAALAPFGPPARSLTLLADYLSRRTR